MSGHFSFLNFLSEPRLRGPNSRATRRLRVAVREKDHVISPQMAKSDGPRANCMACESVGSVLRFPIPAENPGIHYVWDA
ncbi:hypothetical protein VTL71DRAFT_505, partial [Oculimacula yallundae]